jgi:hypothetical protein
VSDPVRDPGPVRSLVTPTVAAADVVAEAPSLTQASLDALGAGGAETTVVAVSDSPAVPAELAEPTAAAPSPVTGEPPAPRSGGRGATPAPTGTTPAAPPSNPPAGGHSNGATVDIDPEVPPLPEHGGQDERVEVVAQVADASVSVVVDPASPASPDTGVSIPGPSGLPALGSGA